MEKWEGEAKRAMEGAEEGGRAEKEEKSTWIFVHGPEFLVTPPMMRNCQCQLESKPYNIRVNYAEQLQNRASMPSRS